MSSRASTLLVGALLALASAVQAQDPSGAWDVSGQDPTLGAFAGTVAVQPAAGGGYEVQRLVFAQRPLQDGRRLAVSWRGTARLEAGGLRVEFVLRRQEFVKELPGVLARTPADRVPLALSALLTGALTGPGARLAGQFPSGPTEAWTRSSAAPVAAPALERRLDRAPVTCPRSLFFRLFRDFHALPAVAPYVPRPEFQAAVHLQLVDDTGRVYLRAHPDQVLVVQKVPDAISVAEESLRADAFRWSLVDKATRMDQDMVRLHIEAATGMLGGVIAASGARVVHGDSGLHQGVWVASQAWRYEATHDPQALANVETGVGALLRMVDAPGTPTEFGRAVMMGPPQPGWAASPAIPGLSYIPGGNNDMLHGVDYGFAAAEHVLPAGHPLLHEIALRTTSLVTQHKLGKSGKHYIIMAGTAARLGGDPAIRRGYRKALLWSPLELLWTYFGEGVRLVQELNGRSGQHLATTTFAALRMLGGASPDLLERMWRSANDHGLRFGWEGVRVNRPGNFGIVAASGGASGAADIGRLVLGEIPYPRPVTTLVYDRSIDAEFCMSPYPAMPWKFDYLRDPGRQQSLIDYPLWSVYDTDNYWKEGPYGAWRGTGSTVKWSPQDILHAYWYGRAHGAISPTD